MNKKHLLINITETIITVCFFFLITGNLYPQTNIQAEVDSYLKDVPFKMPSIGLPHFPDKTFYIVNFGAVGDGHTMNTKAINNAIEVCSEKGGGKVIIPPGLWLTGPIELKSNVNLHLERGAVVVFSKNHDDYPIIAHPHRGYMVAPPVYGYDLENIAITGKGVLDGNGTTWRPVKRMKVTASMWRKFTNSGGVTNSDGTIWYPSEIAMNGIQELMKMRREKKELTKEDFVKYRDALRPKMVALDNSKNIFIDGITIKNSPSFALNPNFDENLVVRDIKINNEYWAQNGDGIDIGSSKNVLVYKCTVTAGDDGICMKASDNKNWSGASLQNVVIEDNVVYHAHGGFVTGSNTNGGMHNIYVKNNDFIGTDVGLRFKSARGRGGLVDNIYIKDIYMKDIVNQAVFFNTYYENVGKTNEPVAVTPRTPIFKNIFMDSIFCIGAKEAASVVGLPEMPIQNIKISNSYFQAERGFSSDYAKDFMLTNVTIAPEEGNVYTLNNSEGFQISYGKCPKGTNVFLKVEGKDSKDIQISNINLSTAKTPVEYGSDANKNAVIRK